MGIFTPSTKRITADEMHHYVMGDLRSGDHALSRAQAEHLKSILDTHVDDLASRVTKEKGINEETFKNIMRHLKDEAKDSYGPRYSDAQLAKIQKHGEEYVRHSIRHGLFS